MARLANGSCGCEARQLAHSETVGPLSDIMEAPTLPVTLNSSASEARAHNELNLLMVQYGQKLRRSPEREADAHALRNLTAVRPYKP